MVSGPSWGAWLVLSSVMSRGGALARTLQVPSGTAIEVRAVPPSGDCFYDCLHTLLPPEGRPHALASSQAMRDLVAARMTQELFDTYAMFAAAGVEDFAWMHHHRAPRDLDALREYARRSGRDRGAGQCLWADEHALQTISAAAAVTLLIIDEQATSSRGSRSGRRRGANDVGPDGRFLAIGHHERCVILHRSRRQHYNAVVVDERPTTTLQGLPAATRALWPAIAVEPQAPGDAAAAAAAPVDLTGGEEEAAAAQGEGGGASAGAGRGEGDGEGSPRRKKPRAS